MNTKNQHTFALHCTTFGADKQLEPERFFECTDQALWHRITHILRLTTGDQVILFDGARQEITLELSEKMFSGKNKVSGIVRSVKESTPRTPTITLMPCLLKREAFEIVIYLAAQMGATTVQPLISAKTQRSWHGDKEHARMINVMIAACEQAKNFVIPRLNNPIPFAEGTSNGTLTKGIYFEDTGRPFLSIAQELIAQSPAHLTLVFGPEGGLTTTEQQHLLAQGFACCALTPTILRAQEAVAVGLGALRSII